MFHNPVRLAASSQLGRLVATSITLAFFSCALAYCQAPGTVITGYFQDNVHPDAANGNSPYYPNRLDSQHSNGASRLTYLVYAFANVDSANNACALANPSDETTMSYDASMAVMGQADTGSGLQGIFHQFQLLKQYNPNLKILVSIGGAAAGTAGFESVTSSSANIASFVNSCVNLFMNGQFFGPSATAYPGIFDGFDIDWEFPNLTPNSGQPSSDQTQYLALLTAFRKALRSGAVYEDLSGNFGILTVAGGTDPGQYGITSNTALGTFFSQVSPLVSFFNVMAYDFENSTVTTFNAPLFPSPLDTGQSDTATYNLDATIKIYTEDGGISPTQLVLGIPFYGYQWTPVSGANDGLFQSIENSGSAQPIYYSQIDTSLPKYCDSGSGNDSCPSTWGSQLAVVPTTGAQETWTFEDSTFTMFDDPGSIAAKVKYAQTNLLAGVLAWDLTEDDSNETLLTAIMNDAQPFPRIFVGGNSAVFGVDANNNIREYNSTQRAWVGTGGVGRDISVGYDGSIWAINSANSIYQFSSNDGWNQWMGRPGTATQIAVGNSSAVWVLSASGNIYKWNGSSYGWWNRISGSLDQIAVGSDGDTWGINNAGEIYHYTSQGTWQLTAGSLNKIVVGSANAVFGLNSVGDTYKWNTTASTWTRIAGGPLAQISVGMDGDLWGLTSTGAIYHCPAGGVSFTFVAGNLQQISVGSSSAVWGVTSEGTVYQYLNGAWTKTPEVL